MQYLVKSTLIFVLFFTLQNTAFSQNQKNNNSINQELPKDFPRYIDTGNPDKDIKNYTEAKFIWIEKNKELYDKMNSQNTPVIISKKDYELLPADKKSNIDKNPRLYTIQ